MSGEKNATAEEMRDAFEKGYIVSPDGQALPTTDKVALLCAGIEALANGDFAEQRRLVRTYPQFARK